MKRKVQDIAEYWERYIKNYIQQLRIKEETKTPHTKVYHFNDTENNSIEEDEELLKK